MEVWYMVMWMAYSVFLFVAALIVLYKCCFCCRRYTICFGDTASDSLSGASTPRSSCTTSRSFTYYATKKQFALPTNATDGLSSFNDSILYRQPMVLTSGHVCQEKKDFVDIIDSTTSNERPSLSPRILKDQVEDDQHSIRELFNSFNKSVLSINSDDEHDKDYCEGSTILVDEQRDLEDKQHDLERSQQCSSRDLKSCTLEHVAERKRQICGKSNCSNECVFQTPVLSQYVSDILEV